MNTTFSWMIRLVVNMMRSIDLLNVDDELATDVAANAPVKHCGRFTNWYAGSFQDGLIPEEGPEILETLKSQMHELHLRDTVRDYARLRNRQLKYFSTVRMIMSENNIPEPTHPANNGTDDRFPSHSQELLLLGSQKLTELRDAIICINDLAINQELSNDPELYRVAHIPNNHTKCMQETTFLDLELRLGYPYVYLHLGNCEHIITFTDVRLHHQDDIQGRTRYPLFRGQASKLSVNWIVREEPRLPVPNAHLCDRCLKAFCYDNRGIKINNIKIYPFIDEFMSQQKKFLGHTQISVHKPK
ncbi:snRNA-activating protein complex subunit 3-like [Homarus americanus]|uniref:snRNA-activating protein complex subunit 3 n=1 Tax=Homarus americanus TaxID=6706 RepID=A0A8J5JXS1_HOMAM|nr:snRNA-activating protein complex subunit 3-like [Homarus americanus]